MDVAEVAFGAVAGAAAGGVVSVLMWKLGVRSQDKPERLALWRKRISDMEGFHNAAVRLELYRAQGDAGKLTALQTFLDQKSFARVKPWLPRTATRALLDALYVSD